VRTTIMIEKESGKNQSAARFAASRYRSAMKCATQDCGMRLGSKPRWHSRSRPQPTAGNVRLPSGRRRGPSLTWPTCEHSALGCPWSKSKGPATGKTGPRGRLEPPREAPCQRISIHLPDVVAYGAGALAAPSGSARRLLAGPSCHWQLSEKGGSRQGGWSGRRRGPSQCCLRAEARAAASWGLDLPRFRGGLRAWDQGIWSDGILPSCLVAFFFHSGRRRR